MRTISTLFLSAALLLSPAVRGQQTQQSDPAQLKSEPKAESPCEVAPKKPGLFDRIKKQAKQTIERRAENAAGKVGKATKDTVDPKDTKPADTKTEEPKPCPPAKDKEDKK